MSACRAWIRAPRAALALPADIPDLTVDAAISRSWSVPPGRCLLEPNPPAYLPAYPLAFGDGFVPWPWAPPGFLFEWRGGPVGPLPIGAI